MVDQATKRRVTQIHMDAIAKAHEKPTLLPIGTRIVFIKSLYGDANEFQPAHIFARKGDGGVITGHGCKEGYWVKWDHWPHAFGAEHGVDFIASVSTGAEP